MLGGDQNNGNKGDPSDDSEDYEELRADSGDEKDEEDKEEEKDQGLPSEEELPPYMREEEPEGQSNKAKYWLLQGMSDEEITEQKDITPGTVRVCRSELVSEGLLKKKPRGIPPGGKKKTTAVATRNNKTLQIFAKGSPPEALIQAIELSGVDGQLIEFEHGMKFGMSILVTAVRVMNELSIIGSQQVKPLLDMTKSMREGEAQSYKAGADEAAYKAASAISQSILPEVDAIRQSVSGIEKGASAGGDPVKAMMVRTMEPLIQNLMGKIMPGGAAGAGSTGGTAPQGWTKKAENTEKTEKTEKTKSG